MTPTTIAPFAAAASNPVTLSSAGGVLRVALALLVVLAAVVAAGWLSRRVRGFGPIRGRELELLTQLPLGPRERAVLLRVGAQQLLLGVAQGSVRLLHVLERPTAVQSGAASAEVAPAAESVERPSFRALLLRGLGK
jgi:flagellar protein FliO/FliZ